MNKHTPGPWAIDQHQKGCFYIVAEQGKKWNNPEICDLYTDVTPEDSVTIGPWLEPKENAEANANLIAAAPELLEALERLLIVCETPYPGCILSSREAMLARQAIAKAKGQQQCHSK